LATWWCHHGGLAAGGQVVGRAMFRPLS